MLRNLLSGTKETESCLFIDTVASSSFQLWLTSIQELAHQFHEIHLLCFERCPEVYKALPIFNTKVHFYDGTKDPCDWYGEEVAGADRLSYCTLFCDMIAKHRDRTSTRILVAADSLSFAVLETGVSSICQRIHRLLNNTDPVKFSVLLRVQGDIINSFDVSCLSHVLSTTIKVCSSPNPSAHFRCYTVHKRASGKILRSVEDIAIDKDYKMTVYTEVSDGKLINADKQPQEDLVGNLTFKLSLSQKEEKDRQNLVLPHVKDVQSSGVQAGAEIYYMPDSEDDFDEEDPDNDLYI